MKNEKGSLTIEASVALVVFMFFILAFLTIGRYTRIQNQVKHSLDQAAITMSMRNYQLTQIDKAKKSLLGTNSAGLSQIIGFFDPNLAKSFSEDNGTPYTQSIESMDKTKSNAWSSTGLKTEIMRLFAYYYVGGNYSDWENASYEQVTEKLKKSGMVIEKVSDGSKDDAEFVSGNKLTVEISYRINAGVSFYSFFGKNNSPRFTDSITVVLMR